MHKRTGNRPVIALLLAALLGGCGQMQPMGSRSDMINYQVRPGDTLYSIAWRYGYDHREVAAWNNIPAPFTIHPGQRLYIISPYQRGERKNLPRDRAAATATGGGSAAPSRKPAAAVATSRPATSSASRKVEKTATKLHNRRVHWQWPTSGKLVTKYSPANGKKGLDIGGKLGQAIKAAADGKVVYSGSGLIGYGNLIIIKHNDMYLSAYGHNRRLLVKEGTMVKQGQKIAEMGDSGKNGVTLHFEIRRDGKPVDPLGYLPKNGS
jgi:lipoprotein NlpD